ncbi:hypothetical protein NLU13_1212 [Sarocladium strictum]|uniref:Uncharacterized protein n=1 Tax=Sarocladium strictum TaxID=5046 RepID=A0AA39LC07_SARSR|nr:hypothetical protein NLU13_1212 [Sarocladium strictum]
MPSISNKVKDAVGLGSHDSKHQSSGLTGNTAPVSGNSTLPNDSLRTGTTTNDTLSPNTAQTSNSSGRRLSDAAKMPPSAFRQQVGEPVIEHNYPQDSTYKRHSVSHQENHYLR